MAVGDARFGKLTAWSATCVGLKEERGAVTFEFQPGIGNHIGDEAVGFFATSVFYQVARLPKLLDASVPVGGGWSGESFSYTYRPLRTTVTVKSDTESVTVPAGAFERCLLVEYLTEEPEPDEQAPERERNLNRGVVCGTRRAWYAPGVGLVQLQIARLDGEEAVLQLHEYEVAPSESYLPLASGNAWTYRQTNLPPGCVTKEAYRISTREGEAWCLEEYGYLYQEET